MFRSQYECPDCGGSDAYRSRRRSFFEKYALPLFLLRPARCVNCFRRVNVSIFVSIPKRGRRSVTKRQAAA
jgi:hypothetical protein